MSTTGSAAAGDLTHAAKAAPAAAPNAPANADYWARLVLRALRGKYRFTAALVLAVGVIGASIGWKLAGPLYRSEGMVRIASALPAVIKETDQNRQMPMFDSFLQAQREIVTSRPVLEEVFQDPVWSTQAIRAMRRPTVEELAARLMVEVKPKSENIRISFTDASPVLASTAVTSTIKAYQKIYTRDHLQLEQQRLQLLEDYRKSLMSQLNLATTDTGQLNPDAQGPSSRPAGDGSSPASRLSPERLAMVDLVMRHLLDDRTHAQDEVDQATIVYGPNHPMFLRLQMNLQKASEHVQRYLDEYKMFHALAPGTVATQSGSDGQNLPLQAVPLSASMQQAQNELEDVSRRIEVLKTENAMPKRLEIVSIGEFPVAAQDRRIKSAAVGGMMGGSLAFGVMVLVGVLRRRYDYCAEVVEDFAGRTPFVAVVPEVDPKCLSDAAQCVHHLREAVKQNARTYLITSAGRGEGTTSLAMSLAISMCASGCSTLVIDADVASRGLSRILKLDNAKGFYQALTSGDFASYLQITRSRMAILPIGQATLSDGLSMTALSMGGLLERLREIFDAILIDSGSLSSVETSVIAKQVEGVILTVGRGQEQAMVRSALGKLDQMKAKVLGAVFNRAQIDDFYASIQRSTPRAASFPERRQASELLSGFSPLVRAVALSLRSDIELLPESELIPIRERFAGAVTMCSLPKTDQILAA